MSSAPVESAATRGRPGMLASLITVVVTPILSAGLSVFLVLAILHFLTRVPGSAVENGTVGDPRLLRDIIEPFAQNGTVAARQVSDVVYYPIPYATPPHLTLTSKSEDRTYVILRQDEFGFAWAATADLKAVKDLAEKLKGAKDLQDLGGALAGLGTKSPVEVRPGDEFTWEARGVRPFTTVAAMPPFVQTGTFGFPANQTRDGVEYFQYPYATSPNVALSDARVKILATAPTGFRWQGTSPWHEGVTTKWTAKGIRATPEQVDALAKNPPRLQDEQVPVLEDKGALAFAPGEQGAAAFTRPFATPPNVDVHDVIVTEITTTGFKWKHHGTKNPNALVSKAAWTAKGVLESKTGKGKQ
jgi:hypothetical protein